MYISYEALRAFAAVIQEGGFERAAAKLHITQSAVSQRIRLLEDQLGQRIILRGAPPLPTARGRFLLQHITRVAQWEGELLTQLKKTAPDELAAFPIAVNADSLDIWFFDALTAALKKRRMLVHLLLEDEQYTHEMLRRGEVVGAISAAPDAPHGCTSTPLGSMRYHCVATPGFRAKYFPRRFDRKSILKAPAALYNRRDTMHKRFLTQHAHWDGAPFPHHLIPSSAGFAQMTIRGLAYGVVPEPQIKEALKKGTVVNLAPGKYVEEDLYWHAFRLQPPEVEKLTEELIAAAQQALR